MNYTEKYLKYKTKYNKLKYSILQGGSNITYEQFLNDDGSVSRYKIMNIQKSDVVMNDPSTNSEVKKEVFFEQDDFKDVDILIRNGDDPACIMKSNALIFCGGIKHSFDYLYIFIKNYNGQIIYMRDRENKWYSGLIMRFKEIIEKRTADIGNFIFVGSSMGGYPALYLSVLFPTKKVTCVTFSPQTLNFQTTEKIRFAQNLIMPTAENSSMTIKFPLIINPKIEKNISDVLTEHRGYNAKIYILMGKSECDDSLHDPSKSTKEDMYFDAFHAGALVSFPNVGIVIFNHATHKLSKFINLLTLLKIFNESFDRLVDNQTEGLNMLRNIPDVVK
jgi:hypothetical protein